jgi:uncharacterized damage-inducible protein DinB
MIKSIVNQNKNVLMQIHASIALLSNNEYAERLEILSNSSIGMHIRHIVEFYECLVKGMQSTIINYDARQRNLEVETNKEFSLECLLAIVDAMDNFEKDTQLQLLANLENEAELFKMPTSIFRELYYLLEHTTHHMAIIKMAFLDHFTAHQLSATYGVASSTLQYQSRVHSNVYTS